MHCGLWLPPYPLCCLYDGFQLFHAGTFHSVQSMNRRLFESKIVAYKQFAKGREKGEVLSLLTEECRLRNQTEDDLHEYGI